MTIRVVDGRPYACLVGAGLVPVRGASQRVAHDLETVIAIAQLTGRATMTVADIEVEPDIGFDEERPIGFGGWT